MNQLPKGEAVDTVRLHSAALIPGLGSKKVLDSKELKFSRIVYVIGDGLYVESKGDNDGKVYTHVPFTAVESVVFQSDKALKSVK